VTLGIMFHSVGLRKLPWRSAHVSEDLGPFQAKLRRLTRTGYETRHMGEALRPAPSGRPSVALTFDDGYLDNWVHVFPVLEKYALKATIFVSTDFVDPRPVLRPRRSPEEVSDRGHDPAHCCAGFLSWPELRAMQESGLVEIQSHTVTHTWHFTGPKVVGFWNPGSATRLGGPGWMLWNEFPALKPRYLTDSALWEERIPYGTPVFEHARALVARRFFPDPEPGVELARFVARNGGAEFFRRPGWEDELRRKAAGLAAGGIPGRHETDDEYRGRICAELSDARRILEQELGRPVNALCWPGGAVNREVLEMAVRAGYEIFTLPSAWRAEHALGHCDNMLPRIGSVGRVRWRGLDLGNPTALEFEWVVRRHLGSTRAKWLGRGATALRAGFGLLTPASVGMALRKSRVGRRKTGSRADGDCGTAGGRG
jgi:peptidoglycan/xylan/chitin deacetylase (PgdA/CDA1 family)